MERVILYKHGVSVQGELQVYRVARYMEGDVVEHEVIDQPYSPKDIQKMGDFDVLSQQIVEAIYIPEIIEEVRQDIAYFMEELVKPGFRQVIRYDRMFDDLARVSIRQAKMLIVDGKIPGKKYHRSWIMPGSSYLNKDVISRRLAEVFHTPQTIEIYQTAMDTAGAFEKGLNGEEIVK